MFTIARIKARAGKPVAGFLIRTAIRIHGRIHPASALPPEASPGAPSEPATLRPRSRGPSVLHKTTNDHEGASMTAYLISLSLAGMVAIAVWEASS
jgi:hypothetical protein